jgi:hypothetical protein
MPEIWAILQRELKEEVEHQLGYLLSELDENAVILPTEDWNKAKGHHRCQDELNTHIHLARNYASDARWLAGQMKNCYN